MKVLRREGGLLLLDTGYKEHSAKGLEHRPKECKKHSQLSVIGNKQDAES